MPSPVFSDSSLESFQTFRLALPRVCHAIAVVLWCVLASAVLYFGSWGHAYSSSCMDYRVSFSMLKEKLEKKNPNTRGLYIFRNKHIHFLGSFISTLVSCEEIMVKQKVFHLSNKNSAVLCTASFFIGLGGLRPAHFLVS